MHKIKGLNLIGMTAMLALNALAGPAINGISGIAKDGETITISGSGFGTGPKVHIFDDFNGGAPGADVDLKATYGSWDKQSRAVFVSAGHSGAGVQGYCQSSLRAAPLYHSFPNTKEIFVSYWWRIPVGGKVPGGGVNSYPTGSHLKNYWITYDGGYNADGLPDLVLPTYNNSWKVTGNQGNGMLNTGAFSQSEVAVDGTWNRTTFHLKQGGTHWGQNIRENQSVAIWTSGNSLFESTTPAYFNEAKLHGWFRTNTSGAKFVSDEFYFASGANAAARVEIGDAPSYSSCRNLAICTPTSWSSGSIEATVRTGSFKLGEKAYVFVIDKNGNASAGKEVVMGEGQGQTRVRTNPASPGLRGTRGRMDKWTNGIYDMLGRKRSSIHPSAGSGSASSISSNTVWIFLDGTMVRRVSR